MKNIPAIVLTAINDTDEGMTCRPEQVTEFFQQIVNPVLAMMGFKMSQLSIGPLNKVRENCLDLIKKIESENQNHLNNEDENAKN